MNCGTPCFTLWSVNLADALDMPKSKSHRNQRMIWKFQDTLWLFNVAIENHHF